MEITHRLWRYLLLPLTLAGTLSISSAAEVTPAALNPAALIYKLPDQIPGVRSMPAVDNKPSW